MHGDRHVARRAPAHHRVVLRRARAQHLALAVARADDHRGAGAESELGARHGFELTDHGVGGHHSRELAEPGTGQLPHGIAVEVIQPAARRERGVRHDLVRHAVDDQVPRRQDDVGRLHALGLVLVQPGELGRHRSGVERDPRARTVDVIATHALGQGPCRKRGAVVGPQDALADRVSLCIHRDKGLPGARAGDDVHLGERPRRLGPSLGAGDDQAGPPAQRVLLGPADLGMRRGQLGTGQGDQASVTPQTDLGDGRAEVDGEDHRSCTSAPTRPAISAGSVSW